MFAAIIVGSASIAYLGYSIKEYLKYQQFLKIKWMENIT